MLQGTNYRLLQWLGEGGMGVVYEALHVGIDRHVALKVIRADAVGDPDSVRVFREEARAVGRVGSEHVVEVFDAGELPDGRVWYVMELLPRRSLAHELESTPMAIERLIAVLRQICKGLGAVHAAGIVHRDVKPENVLLGKRGGRSDFAKLVDFGVAVMLSEAEVEHGVGTPFYMAPELCARTSFGTHVDMYSLGCVAYELLVGAPPFVADVIAEVKKMHIGETPKPLGSLVDVPPALERVIMRCLEKAPDDRYTDMNDLEAAICEAQLEAGVRTAWDHLPLPEVEDPARRARLSALAQAPARPSSRWRWGVAALVMGLLAVPAYLLRPDPPAVGEVESVVHRLVTEARHAASRALYVYPPEDQPDHPTAYTKVLALDAVSGEDAESAAEAAEELRDDFSRTLVRLGDRYWGSPGGRPFAMDYYAQALVFDPGSSHARERAGLVQGELALLRGRAASLDFSPAELHAAAPLIALAQEDEGERRQQLAAVARRQKKGSRASADLEKVLRAEGVDPREAEPTQELSTEEVSGASTEEPTHEDSSGDATATTPDEPPSPVPEAAEPDPVRARQLVEEAQRAVGARRNDDARKLFHRALEHDSRNADALIGLADMHFNAGSYQRALQMARKAVAVAPRNAGYRIKLGDAYFKLYRYEQAREQYQRAESLGHRDAPARLALINRRVGEGATRPP
jgi:tetratricopeptide (TPR) repeat protein